ncbi:unnamed protein product [Gadus morhua 'NCC']
MGEPDGPPVERRATRVEQSAQGTHSDTGAFIRTPERSGNTFGHRSIDGASSAVLLQLGTDQPRLPHTARHAPHLSKNQCLGSKS